MNPEEFLTIARVLPEPLLLINTQGDILSTNHALAKILNYKRSELRNKLLTDLTLESSDEIIRYLQACSKSRQMIVTSLNFCINNGETLSCRCEGAVIQPSSSSHPAIILLRLENLASANNQFTTLNDKIQKLIAEVRKRKQVETTLRKSELDLRKKAENLEETLKKLKLTQLKLIQSEKMSSLGQMVAGVAHEINNPVSFVYSNLVPACEYAQDLIKIIELYQQHYPEPVEEIQEEIEAVELDFLKEDFVKLLDSMQNGTERIKEIVLSLRNFSRLDESEFKQVDIHEGIDSTLLILQNRFKSKPEHPEIAIIKQYSSLPKVDCYAGQLNQVFMNILVNAIDALEDKINKIENINKTFNPQIKVSTELFDNQNIVIRIANNGSGIPPNVQSKLFDPFFTTKKVGKGTGLGLSISYKIIVDKHHGKLSCESSDEGTEFIIEIPINQK
ncbi:histidine kinase,histidine kinase,PAS domain-containing protein [Rivularia sp. PCC 7116]|uniref:ATP-binding protein n=1 Tax=Rivularia sp. PCC 7116 TaxID=373994 RepID=UPI00029EDB44|nr:ATP-binding protein [Rivularia sp. PCC 7116]AFY52695.1 histidine kinase,histidine kinase,PAS domain-containing protein [Rivularia sp. PCC 7116]